jgi:chromosome partitioning protein
MRTFAILNMKGGVGKTVTAINLSYLLAAEYGLRVLLVDADGQANATRMLLPEGEHEGLAEILSDLTWMNRETARRYDNNVQPTDIENLDVMPASTNLWAIDRSPRTTVGETYVSVGALMLTISEMAEDDAYDVVVIDCPPNFSNSCIAGIAAANSIIIPVLPDAFSAAGMAELVKQIDGVREIKPDVRISGCLITQWHKADVVEQTVAHLRAESPVPVYDTVIRRTDKVLESTWARQPVLIWSPQSSAAKDYRAWVAELVEKEGLLNG